MGELKKTAKASKSRVLLIQFFRSNGFSYQGKQAIATNEFDHALNYYKFLQAERITVDAA